MRHPPHGDRTTDPGQPERADPARTTGTTPPPTTRRARSTRGLLAVLATMVAVLATVGVGVSVAAVSSARSANTPRSVGVGGVLSTSYGHLAVTNVENVEPMSHEDMVAAGDDMGDMGINDFVPEGDVGITMTLSIYNGRDHTVEAATPGEFHLLRTQSGRTTTFSPKRTTLAVAGSLPAHSSVDTLVTFVIPAGTSALHLSYQDPDGGSPLTVDLGHAQAATEHHH